MLLLLGGCVLLFADPPGRAQRELEKGRPAAVAAGDGEVCVVYESGWLACSGPADGPANDVGYIGVRGDSEGWCAITVDNSVVCWGGLDSPGVSGVDQLVVSAGTACALQSGEISCWGSDDYDRDEPLDDAWWDKVALGRTNGCALSRSGGVDCWGEETAFSGRYGDMDGSPSGNLIDVAVSEKVACTIIRVAASVDDYEPGDIVCWGDDDRLEDVPEGPFDAVLGGSDHFCALAGGIASCWGNDPVVSETPSDVRFSSLALGGTTDCGFADGELLCWGDIDGMDLW